MLLCHENENENVASARDKSHRLEEGKIGLWVDRTQTQHPRAVSQGGHGLVLQAKCLFSEYQNGKVMYTSKI